MLKFFSFFPVFFVFLQAYYMYQIHITSNLGQFTYTFSSVFSWFLSLISIYLLSLLVLSTFKRPPVRLFVACALILFFNILIAYHFSATQQFEWSFFADNTDIILSWDSLYTIFHSLDLGNLSYAPVIIGIILYVDYKRKSIRFPKWTLSRFTKSAVLIIYLCIILFPVPIVDPFVSLLRSAVYYYNSPVKYFDDTFEMPLKILAPSDISRVDRPHVFLIVVESLNYDFLDYKDVNDDPVTPFLKELMNRSIYVENFYGNSIQTAKGHAAIFLSTMPSFRGKIFRKFENVKFDSVFNAVKRHNYHSVVFLGNQHLNYDNTKPFLMKQGLNEMVSVYDYMTKDDERYITRWGVREDVVVSKFFDFFDTINLNSSKPLFSTIITVQSHFPFILPVHMRQIWKDPKTTKQNYANCLKNIDDAIRLFYQELEDRGLSDSIVIITSDHAFPMNDQMAKSLEASYHEDSYRIPFIMTAPKLLPSRFRGPFSQMDIAPTILDLLNIPLRNTRFMGQSIFSNGPNSNLVLQIQPYEKQIGVVELPYKYRYSAKTDSEYVFNINLDPLEKNNIISEISTDSLQLYRSKVSEVYNIQRYYELND